MDLASCRGDRPSTCIPPNSIDGNVARDLRAGTPGGEAQAVHIARRIQRAAALVDDHTVIRIAPELGSLIAARDELDAVVKDAGEQRLFAPEGLEMRRLVGCLEVAGPPVLAGDRFLSNQRFEPFERRARRIEQLPRAHLAVARDECGRVELQPGQDLPAIAGARTPSYLLAIDNQHRCAGTCEMTARGQPGVAGPDNHDVEPGSRFDG